MPLCRSLVAVLAATLLASACTGSDGPTVPTSSTSAASTLAASVGSGDLSVGSPQRFQIGVYSSDGQGVKLLAFGQVKLDFSYLGDGSGAAEPGPQATGDYIGAFGTPQDGPAPVFEDPSDARGVYQAEVEFDRAGTWQVDVTVDVPGASVQTLATAFPVLEEHALPAPGDRALRTDNLTMSSKDAPPAAIDSRALDGAPVPDPDLHQTTIADALARHRPILVIFATPTFCQSQFCGPETDGLEALARRYPDRAVYVHVEIWRNFDKSVVNKAAADWLYRNGDITEPWLFLIGPDGVIKDRWGPLFDPNEVAKELAQLPRTKP
ncbi:MAG: TlpA family protein disulfide reductase [Actinomycetota bacterium]